MTKNRPPARPARTERRLTPELARAALSYLNPGSDRDAWVRVLMALKASDLPAETAHDLAREWSERGDTFNEADFRATWRSIKSTGGVGVGTLFALAQERGFRFPDAAAAGPPAPPPAPDEELQRQRRRAAEEAEYRARADRAARDAAALWAEGSDDAQAPYLARKSCRAYGVRSLPDGTLLVPLRDAAGALLNVQRIAPQAPTDGSSDKRFLPGGRKRGLFHLMGSTDGAAALLVAEGYATSSSLHEATGHPTAVAFDCGNLAPVCKVLRELHPALPIVVCADDDRPTEARSGKNPGRLAAATAARAAHTAKAPAGVAVPEGLQGQETDFNDLAQRAGLQAVREQIARAVARPTIPKPQRAAAAGRRGDESGADGAAAGPAEKNAAGGRFDPFRVDDDGVWFDPPGNDGGGPRRVCDPIRVVAVARDESDGGAALLVEFASFGKTRRTLVPLTMFAGDGASYRTMLNYQGFRTPVDRHRRQWLTEYLSSRRPADLVLHVPRVGWCGSCYVLPDETLGDPGDDDRVMFHSEVGKEANFAQRGTLSTWQADIARLCVGNSRMAFAVAGAFAGPLLHWSPVKSGGGFHYYGKNSAGKTTGFLAAASVYGKGTESDPTSYLQSWRATSNGLEFQAEQHNDCTLILDELGAIDPAEAGAAAYMLASGQGKTRGRAAGGLRHKPTWRLLSLSSGELTLEQHMAEANKKMKGGQEIRLIPIPAEVTPESCFDTVHEFPNGFELAEWIKRRAAECYGTAGRAWLQWLVDNLDWLPELIRERMADFDREYLRPEMTGQVLRGARRFALVAAAGEIATRDARLTGWPEGEAMRAAGIMMNAWIASRDAGMGNSDDAAAMRDMRMHFLQFGTTNYRRWGITDADHGPGTPYMYGWRKPVMVDERNAAGEVVEVQRGTVFYVQKDAFKTVVCKGHRWERCIELLRARKLLVLESSQEAEGPEGGRARRRADTWAKPPGEKGVSVYRIRSDILSEGAGQD